MDHREVGRYWDENADAWTQLARAGYDLYRDQLNTPAFFEMLPDVSGRGMTESCVQEPGWKSRGVPGRGVDNTVSEALAGKQFGDELVAVEPTPVALGMLDKLVDHRQACIAAA